MARSVGIGPTQVVEVAAELADQRGLEHLTLAHVASVLGVRLPSLYNHVDGMPGLKRELAIYGLRELNERLRTAAIGKSSDAAIIALAEAYRRFVHERPGLYAATVHAPAPDDELHQQISRTIMQVVAAVLAPYQLSEIGLIHAIRSFRSITHGFASLELAGGFALEADRDESFHVLIQTYIVGLQAWQNY